WNRLEPQSGPRSGLQGSGGLSVFSATARVSVGFLRCQVKGNAQLRRFAITVPALLPSVLPGSSGSPGGAPGNRLRPRLERGVGINVLGVDDLVGHVVA